MQGVMRDLQILLEQSNSGKANLLDIRDFAPNFRDRENDVLGEFYG
jgi:hypothetical protein